MNTKAPLRIPACMQGLMLSDTVYHCRDLVALISDLDASGVSEAGDDGRTLLCAIVNESLTLVAEQCDRLEAKPPKPPPVPRKPPSGGPAT